MNWLLECKSNELHPDWTSVCDNEMIDGNPQLMRPNTLEYCIDLWNNGFRNNVGIDGAAFRIRHTKTGELLPCDLL